MDCSFVFALISELRMLSLVLGVDITDASVASIASSYPNLELLDLSGYAFLLLISRSIVILRIM